MDESADQRTYIIEPCKNVAAYWTVLLADAEGQEALLMLKRFLKSPQTQTSFVFRTKRGTALRETSVLHKFLYPVLRALELPQAGMQCFSSQLQSQMGIVRNESCCTPPTMGHSFAVMTARYTGEIPLDKVQEAFSKMEMENMEVFGKRPHCTGSRLVVYNQ